jgi:anti-anti-sigma factor
VSFPAAFRVTIEQLDEACLVRASGELDRSTAEHLSSALEAVRADGLTMLLDLSAVRFIDSAGLRVLLCSAHAADADGSAWFIVGTSSAVRRLIDLTGTGSQLPLRPAPKHADQRLAG